MKLITKLTLVAPMHEVEAHQNLTNTERMLIADIDYHADSNADFNAESNADRKGGGASEPDLPGH